MKDHNHRVNIVLSDELLELADELAKRYHGSRSQAIRQALLLLKEERDGDGGKGIDKVDLRPILEWIEETDERIERIENKLAEMEKGIDFLVGKQGSTIEKASEEIEELLINRGEALTLPEIVDLLPSYEEKEILQALENLEDKLTVKRVEAEKGPMKWKIRGG